MYDSEKGDFHLRFAKINKGEHFENLDLITNLLAPTNKNKNVHKIEVIGKNCTYIYDINKLHYLIF